MAGQEHRTAVALGAVATAIGVPAGIALSGGEVTAAGAVPLAALLAALVPAGRRWPLAALVCSVAVTVAYRTAGLVDAGWVWPATVAFAVAVLAGRTGWSYGLGALTMWFGAVWEWAVGGQDVAWLTGPIGVEALWLLAVLAGATAVRDRRRWREETAARHRQSMHEREIDAQRRRAEERVRLAREVHDVVAHTLAVVGVHLHVALDTLDTAPDEAREALRLAQDVRGTAMADLKALVEVLRDGVATAVESPVAQLDGVAELVERVRTSNLAVSLDETGDRHRVPAPVASTVYRIVQEALTNTVRHAAASRVDVVLCYGPDRVTLHIADNGHGGDPEGVAVRGAVPGGDAGGGVSAGGHGLAGMRERVAALGGALTAGPAEGGGFAVRAAIPIGGPT